MQGDESEDDGESDDGESEDGESDAAPAAAPPAGPLLPPWLATLVGLALASLLYGPVTRVVRSMLDARTEPASRYDAELVGIEVRELVGRTLPYRLALPPSGWRAFSADTRALEAPLADHWLRRSDVGAELMVVSIHGVSLATTTPDDLEEEAQAELSDDGFELLPVEDWPLPHGGRASRSLGRVPDVGDTAVVFGHWVTARAGYRILITVPPERWPAFESEARALLAAFDPGT